MTSKGACLAEVFWFCGSAVGPGVWIWSVLTGGGEALQEGQRSEQRWLGPRALWLLWCLRVRWWGGTKRRRTGNTGAELGTPAVCWCRRTGHLGGAAGGPALLLFSTERSEGGAWLLAHSPSPTALFCGGGGCDLWIGFEDLGVFTFDLGQTSPTEPHCLIS